MKLIVVYQEVVSRKVLVDEGSRQVVQVEQAAIWKFLWLSGTISVNVLVEQNRDDHSVRIVPLTSEFYSLLLYSVLFVVKIIKTYLHLFLCFFLR